MMMTVRPLGLALLLGIVASLAFAQQNDAQMCIRAYEDRNRSGTLDAGEPFVTKDVGVNLANPDGVIVRTLLLDDSPNATSGVACFTQLAAGQYTLTVASAAYTLTTDSAYVSTVGASAVPLIFDVGLERITTVVPQPEAIPGTLTQAQARYALERIFVAGIAALVVVVVMAAIGGVIYAAVLRPRLRVLPRPVPGAYRQTDTGLMYAVRPPQAPPAPYMRPDTGAMPPVGAVPPAPPAEPPPSADDTDRYKPPQQ